MIEPFVYGGYRFVACPSRLGTVIKIGPVTGKRWLIGYDGQWIDDRDADELVGIEEITWCFKLERYIKIITVFNSSPSEVRIKELKELVNGDKKDQ